MDHALNVLHGIAVAKAVAQAAVNKRGRTRPGECHKAVVGVPGVHHHVEFRARRFYPEARKFCVPAAAQRLPLRAAYRLGRFVGAQQGRALLGGLFAQQERNGFCLAGLQRYRAGERAAAVAVVVQRIAQIAAGHARGAAVIAVRAKECAALAAVRGYRSTRQAEKALGNALVVHLHAVQIAVDELADAVLIEQCARDEQRILQIYLIELVIAVVRKLGVARQRQRAGPARIVAHRQLPHLVGFAQRHIVQRLAVDAGIIRADFCIAHAVAAFAAVVCQIFAHRLPRGRPVIARFVVAQVNIPAGAVERVENIPQDAPVRTRSYKAVAPGVVGDERAVLGRA